MDISPEQKRKEVLEAAMLDVEEKDHGGLQVHITKQLYSSIQRLQRRHRWPHHIVALAMEMTTGLLCEAIWDKSEEFRGGEK